MNMQTSSFVRVQNSGKLHPVIDSEIGSPVEYTSARAGTPARYALLMMDARITAWISVFFTMASVARPGNLSSSCRSQMAFAPPLMVDATVDMAATWLQSMNWTCSRVWVPMSAPAASTAAWAKAIGR